MSAVELLRTLTVAGQDLRQVDDDIHSVIPSASLDHGYDRVADMYDSVIGNRYYNRFVWGNWPAAYADFCADALRSASGGCVLDAGCGTLVFTAATYLEHADRPIVLLDRSLGMLRKARDRLINESGSVPDHLALVQGDMSALPFGNEGFATVLSWGTVHLFDEPARILNELKRVTASSGRMFLTSLVLSGRFSDRYLRFLSKSGKVAEPVDAATLASWFAQSGLRSACALRGSMAYCSAVKGGAAVPQ